MVMISGYTERHVSDCKEGPGGTSGKEGMGLLLVHEMGERGPGMDFLFLDAM